MKVFTIQKAFQHAMGGKGGSAGPETTIITFLLAHLGASPLSNISDCNSRQANFEGVFSSIDQT